MFETLETGMYGISGPPEFEIPLPPVPDIPSGPTSGQEQTEYPYTTTSFSPSGDQVYYWFDWEDETGTGWLGPYSNEEICEASHAWSEPGTYEITIKSENEWGWESEWSEPLTVTMTKSRPVINPLLKIFEPYPALYQIIRIIMRAIN